MAKRVCVFIDGENFRYSIIKLFETEFDKTDYLPRNADWDKLFDWLVLKAFKEGERLRTYWYVIQSLDFFPYRFPNAKQNPDELRRLLEKDRTSEVNLKNLQGDALIEKMGEIVSTLRKLQTSIARRFEGWRELQDGISSNWSRIEFRRAGAITYNLFEKKFGKEKAVDVKLATDLIMLRDIYDVAVIVSGDQDYVPAVQVIKDSGKHVVNVAFQTRSGKLLPGGAKRLNQITDWSLEIGYSELGEHLQLVQKSS